MPLSYNVKKKIPNIISMSRISIILLIIPLSITGNFLTATILYFLAATTDFIDGKLARKWNVTSKTGAMLDSVADKFLILSTVPIAFTTTPMILGPLLMEGAISIENSISKFKDKNIMKSTFIGKAKMFPLSLVLALGLLSNVNFDITPHINNIMTVLIPITMAMQTATVITYYNQNKKMNKKKLIETELNKSETIESPVLTNDKSLDKKIKNVYENDNEINFTNKLFEQKQISDYSFNNQIIDETKNQDEKPKVFKKTKY